MAVLACNANKLAVAASLVAISSVQLHCCAAAVHIPFMMSRNYCHVWLRMFADDVVLLAAQRDTGLLNLCAFICIGVIQSSCSS